MMRLEACQNTNWFEVEDELKGSTSCQIFCHNILKIDELGNNIGKHLTSWYLYIYVRKYRVITVGFPGKVSVSYLKY